jgi:gamma-glutamyl hydrolase
MIGIIALPKRNGKGSVYPENYVKWVEASGSKAVVIPYDLLQLEHCLHALDGIVWTGGGIESADYSEKQYTTYMKTLILCFETAKRYNEAGRYYPIFGICLGFEILVVFSKKVRVDAFYKMKRHFRESRDCITLKDSRMKKWFLPLEKKMAVQPCATHHHKFGFDIKPLKGVTIVSTDKDFINMIEYKKYPFYGVQFHPERPFDAFSRQVSLQFSLFLKHECEKN